MGGVQIMNLGPGGAGGFGGGGPMIFMMGGPGGFGGGGARSFRNFNVNKPHGSIFYNFGGSPLDAKPFSLNGDPEDKASYDQNRFGVSIGGPLNIPHVYHGGTKTFIFGNYTGMRGNNPYDVFSTVPTQAERSGDFSGSGVQLRDPITRAPLTNNQITNINPAASALLSFIPLPNLPGTTRNFHFISSNQSTTDVGMVRINHNFGADQGMMGMFGARRQVRQQRRQQQNGNDKDQPKEKSRWSHSINGGFNFSRTNNQLLNPFPTLGGELNAHSYNANAGYTAVKGVFLNSLRFNYNRSNNTTVNQFTGGNNIEAQLGITGTSQLPNDFGLPVLNFAPEFSGLQDTSPQFRVQQNYSFSDSMSLSHGKHSWTWGGDFRHQLLDVSNASNARGTFVFTGAASGLPFADFLLGFAQQTSVQFGAEDYHFHANSFDVFGQDNWRAAKNLTLNLGLRYEFVAPYSESRNKLVNLDIAPGFTAVAPVLPGQAGPLTGIQYSSSLINPDRNNFAPRVGIAWKPFSKTVVRSGYGINYNLGQYGAIVTQLGFQPPFAFTQTNTAATPTSLTLQNGFPANAPSVTNNYAVDPNYRLAYVQSWNVNIQQELKGDMLLNIGYTGSKGTHLDMVRAPSLDSNGVLLNNAQPFLFESSNGSSVLHSGSVRLRKRMRHGLSVGGTYTYSKSIDNASSIGGGAVVVAQNDLDLAAERGLSSFDQRHRLTADYYYELPFGKEKKWLSGNNWAQKIFGGFSFSGNLTVASGTPFSPRIFGSRSDLGRGANGSLRPDLVPGQSITLSDPTIQEWFNVAAFTHPAGQFGDAGRNIIIGPGMVDLDMAVSKTIQVKEMQSLELRISASNALNHVNFSTIDTTFGSPTFGQVIGTSSMRKAQLVARYRF
jgi:outer membrane receptor protein involved in Fe transport